MSSHTIKKYTSHSSHLVYYTGMSVAQPAARWQTHDI